MTNIDPSDLSTLTTIVKNKADAVILDDVSLSPSFSFISYHVSPFSLQIDKFATHVVTGDNKRSLKVLSALAKGTLRILYDHFLPF